MRKATAIPGGGGGGGCWMDLGDRPKAGPDEPDLFGEIRKDPHGAILAEEFIIPPFSVLSAREGWWQERKRKWLALGIQSELGRGGELIPNGGGHDNEGPLRTAAPGGSARPACDYSNRQRGDGRGRPL